jgi:hypothetical protein
LPISDSEKKFFDMLLLPNSPLVTKKELSAVGQQESKDATQEGDE